MENFTLLSLRVERRSVAVAVFTGTRLEYTQLRQLSSDRRKADESALAFVNWTVRTFNIHSAAIEPMPDEETRRAELTEIIVRLLRENQVSVWEVSKEELFQAFGIPPLRTRKRVRAAVLDLWPVLRGHNGRLVQDAVAMGLYVQTERLFHF